MKKMTIRKMLERIVVATNKGLGYRFYITKGTQEIEITQATIRFA